MKSVPWEVGIMAYLCKPPTCPSIIQLLDWYEMEKLLILVLEMPAPCLDLEKLIKLNGILTEPTAKHLFRQLAQALHHCESRGVFHRDVKPDNILVQFGTETLKLIDFGCSILHKGNSYIKFDGMLPFAPPELISEKRYQASSYTVWCYGCTLYYCLSRRLAPGVSGDNLNGKLHLATRFSKELEDFLCQCLSLSPEKRPTLKEILRHPWLLRS
ncbi:serine/threonine-protein kinase pim-3-like [Polypterus senegalus]|nr:serine/threonine-protein kinase pim-3-like [Polypterus senegalus]